MEGGKGEEADSREKAADREEDDRPIVSIGPSREDGPNMPIAN